MPSARLEEASCVLRGGADGVQVMHSPDVSDAMTLDYQPLPNTVDEMRDATGSTRGAWRRLEEALGELGGSELDRRWRAAQKRLQRNGVTYNMYADSRGIHRPWRLDPIPMMIGAEEWSWIERAVDQRARLMDLLLADLYGPMRVVSDAILPPALVFSNPGFLRPCHGLLPRGAAHVHLYAVDVQRDTEGHLVAMSDRTQAPSGAGYALENRIVMGQTLPQAFRECGAQRLAQFFQDFREALRALSPRKVDHPSIVLLTPGPYNETYFEHSFLVSYLGLRLAQGADLTVRDGRVHLKTLEGLEPVDVILRRVDDSYCDPLSLRPDSALGVAGLCSAVRSGKVAVANALGSGAVESPALIPYLPALARALLGEELMLASVDTFWCGDPAQLAYVREHLDGMVVRAAFASGGAEVTDVGSLDSLQREMLLRRLAQQPARYVAQRKLRPSTAPVWSSRGFEPRAVAVRLYAARQGDGYAAMPGGLTRVAPAAESYDVSMQHGGGSKDTWVLSDGPISQVTLLPSVGQPVRVVRSDEALPSRVADDLFWLGRYVERAESTARYLRTLLQHLTEEGAMDGPQALPALVHATAILTELEADLHYEPEAPDLDVLEKQLLAFLVSDRSPRSLRSVLASCRRCAFAARDRISSDAVHALGSAIEAFERYVSVRPSSPGDAEDLLDRVLLSLAAFERLGIETLARGPAFTFADMGMRIERAYVTARLLWSTVTNTVVDEVPVLFAVLEAADASVLYRQRYLGAVEAAPVVDLLLIDEENPRSVAFQLAVLLEEMQALPGPRHGAARRPEEKILMEVLTRVRTSDAEILATIDEQGRRPALEERSDDVARVLHELSEGLTRSYFAHAIPRISLAGMFGVEP